MSSLDPPTSAPRSAPASPTTSGSGLAANLVSAPFAGTPSAHEPLLSEDEDGTLLGRPPSSAAGRNEGLAAGLAASPSPLPLAQAPVSAGMKNTSTLLDDDGSHDSQPGLPLSFEVPSEQDGDLDHSLRWADGEDPSSVSPAKGPSSTDRLNSPSSPPSSSAGLSPIRAVVVPSLRPAQSAIGTRPPTPAPKLSKKQRQKRNRAARAMAEEAQAAAVPSTAQPVKLNKNQRKARNKAARKAAEVESTAAAAALRAEVSAIQLSVRQKKKLKRAVKKAADVADVADRQADRQTSAAQRKARKQEIRARLETAKKTALVAAAREASTPAARATPSTAVVPVLVPAPALFAPAHDSVPHSADRMSAISAAWKASPASLVSAPPFIRALFPTGQDYANLRRKEMTSRLKTAWTQMKRAMGVMHYSAPQDASSSFSSPALVEPSPSPAAARALKPPAPLTKSGMRVAEDQRERARIIASKPSASAAELQQILFHRGFGPDGGSRQTRVRQEKKRRQRERQRAAAQDSAAAHTSPAAMPSSDGSPIPAASNSAAARPASRSSHFSAARTSFSVTDSDFSQSSWERIVYSSTSRGTSDDGESISDDGSSDAGRSDSNFSEDSAAFLVNQFFDPKSTFGKAGEVNGGRLGRLRFLQALIVLLGARPVPDVNTWSDTSSLDSDDDSIGDDSDGNDSDASSTSSLDSSASDASQATATLEQPFPTSITAAKKLLKREVHINILDFLKLRTLLEEAAPDDREGFRAQIRALRFETRGALIRYTHKNKRYAKKDYAEQDWLDPLLVDLFKRKRPSTVGRN